MIAGAILLQLAFTFDCVDGQLARYTRTFTKLGAWLDSIFDRTKEYAVFAGLAIGASQTGDDVWLLAGAALTLQVMRHSIDFSYPAAQHQAMGAVASRRSSRCRTRSGATVPVPLVPEDGGRRRRPRPAAADAHAARARRLARARPLAARGLGQEDRSASRSASASPRSRSPPRSSTRASRSS